MTTVLTVKQFLENTKSYIEKGWAQNHYSYDKDGFIVRPEMEDAVCWCIRGALYRANFDANADPDMTNYPYSSLKSNPNADSHAGAIAALATHLRKSDPFFSNLARWNDKPGRTKEEVVDLFQKAIDSLE
ncbi:hypothetical protein [Myxococcus phage Mx1]|nr:hypothetical protein [Myxococcus phage Mx1]